MNVDLMDCVSATGTRTCGMLAALILPGKVRVVSNCAISE